jgi:hypothetical protein
VPGGRGCWLTIDTDGLDTAGDEEKAKEVRELGWESKS